MTITVLDNMEYGSDAIASSNYASNGDVETDVTGGTIYKYGNKIVHKFTSNGTLTIPSGMSGNVDVLLVGGGGAGGTWVGAGGGAGGVVYSEGVSITDGGHSVGVGDGAPATTANGHGADGEDSSFLSLTADGGGGGGWISTGGTSWSAGKDGNDGGSGGGGAYYSGVHGDTTGGGYNGGNAAGEASGGGGGAGGVGVNAGSNTGGRGGHGTSAYSDLLIACEAGVDVGGVHYIAGGGGGWGGSTAGSGGNGGGGAASRTNGVNGVTGTANTGGGGGGGWYQPYNSFGGGGGSGIVIISYEIGEFGSSLTLQPKSEPTINIEGSYSLKGIATQTTSLNKTLTRTISSPINLTGHAYIIGKIRASRTGSNIKIGFHDSGGTTTEVTPNITAADTWQTIQFDISAVADANKDAIDQIIITVVNADADNTFYLDNFFAVDSTDFSAGIQVSKAVGYAVLYPIANAMNVSKAVAYAVLIPASEPSDSGPMMWIF